MKISTTGLILKEQNIGEQDRVVTILTAKLGIVRAFVKNGRNIKSPKGSATRLLCYSRLVIYEGRERYIIDEANSEEMFIKLRSNMEKLTLAQYFSELMLTLAPENSNAEEYLSLMLNSLYMLATDKRSAALVKGAFEMRLLSIAGYMADLVCCSNCKCYESGTMYFYPQTGTVMCKNCRGNSVEYSIPIGMGVLTALRHSIYVQPQKLFSFTLPEQSLKLFERCAEEYLLKTLDKGFRTLAFYKDIRLDT